MIEKAVKYISKKIKIVPEVGMILGSGLGHLAQEIEAPEILDYEDIPGFKTSTAPGHKGRFVFGNLCNKKVVCMQGRLHYYEGYEPQDIVYPIKVMKLLGVKTLIITNAAGGINESFNVGDFMLIEDHINLTGRNPLIGKNEDAFGTRFPDMTFAYNESLRELALNTAEGMGIKLQKGVYLGCTGPSFETPAEIRAFRTLGADAVGMSTVFEVIEAVHCGIDVLAISMITNKAAGMVGEKLTEEEVAKTGKNKSEEIKTLIKAIVEKI